MAAHFTHTHNMQTNNLSLSFSPSLSSSPAFSFSLTLLFFSFPSRLSPQDPLLLSCWRLHKSLSPLSGSWAAFPRWLVSQLWGLLGYIYVDCVLSFITCWHSGFNIPDSSSCVFMILQNNIVCSDHPCRSVQCFLFPSFVPWRSHICVILCDICSVAG